MFERLNVIDLSTVLAGPSVGMFFAELGAHVTKIESPKSPDVTRSWKLPYENPNSKISSYFSSINYKKKYLQLDLSDETERNLFLEHLKNADILISNFKKGDDIKFGITDDTLTALNPRLIHGKISGYGPDENRVAYDLILQAETGFMSMNGTPESGPVKMPVALIDVLAAHQLKEGILSALLERTQTERGAIVEVSLYDAAVASLINQASAYLMAGHVAQRIGSLHPNIAPYGEIFTCKDGEQLTFAIGSDVQFHRLLDYLQLTKYVSDTRFENNQERVKHRNTLFELLNSALKVKTSTEVLKWAEGQRVPCGRITPLDQVLSQERVKQLIREETIGGETSQRITSIAFKKRSR